MPKTAVGRPFGPFERRKGAVAEHTKLERALKPDPLGQFLARPLRQVAEHTKLERALKPGPPSRGLDIAQVGRRTHKAREGTETQRSRPKTSTPDKLVAEHTKLERALKRRRGAKGEGHGFNSRRTHKAREGTETRVVPVNTRTCETGRRTHKAREGTETLVPLWPPKLAPQGCRRTHKAREGTETPLFQLKCFASCFIIRRRTHKAREGTETSSVLHLLETFENPRRRTHKAREGTETFLCRMGQLLMQWSQNTQSSRGH